MSTDYKKYKPIRIFGIILVIFGIASFLFFLNVSGDAIVHTHVGYFVIGVSAWHIVTGLGVILRRRWGFYLLKFYLYSSLVAVPIGTIIAVVTLRYMKRNEINKHVFV